MQQPDGAELTCHSISGWLYVQADDIECCLVLLQHAFLLGVLWRLIRVLQHTMLSQHMVL